MMEIVEGRVWKYGDNISTDAIFPGKYTLTVVDPEEMVRHAMEDLDPSFAKGVRKGDVIVAGRNFGCGSSREGAVLCIKHSGVAAVVAESFSRIFFRTAINYGLPVVESPEAAGSIEKGELIRIDFEGGRIYCERGMFYFRHLSKEICEILDGGGLIPYIRNRGGWG